MSEVVMKAWEMPVMINGFSLIILFVFFLDNRQKHHENKTQKYSFFQYMVISNMLLLVFDSITWLAADHPDPAYRIINVAASALYYICTPLPSYFFIRFADVVLNIGAETRNRLNRWYLVPVALHMILAAASPFTGWYFRIDAANAYTRGSILAVSFALSFVLMFAAFGKVLYRYLQVRRENKAKVRNVREYGWMLKFTFIPLLGGVIQVLFNNVTYVWSVTVIALLILYINYQNAEITTDTLTGLYNRRQAFGYFDRFAREYGRDDVNIAVIMLDINNFKSINDRFGHSTGDEAIIAVARALEAEFRWDDYICRFGGDEFLVITKHGDVTNLKSALQRVNDRLKTMRQTGCLPVELSVSAGYSLYSKKNNTLDSLFQKADAMMFEQKAGLMRRVSDRRADAPRESRG
ncbi:MAG: diguanylate cyclase [Bacillota bacterium]